MDHFHIKAMDGEEARDNKYSSHLIATRKLRGL